MVMEVESSEADCKGGGGGRICNYHYTKGSYTVIRYPTQSFHKNHKHSHCYDRGGDQLRAELEPVNAIRGGQVCRHRGPLKTAREIEDCFSLQGNKFLMQS